MDIITQVFEELKIYLQPVVGIHQTILICTWVKWAFQIYVYLRQRHVLVSTTQRVPKPLKEHMSLETFERARLYGIDGLNFFMIYKTYETVVLTAFFHFGGFHKGWLLTAPVATFWPRGWDLEIGRSVAFNLLAMVVSALIIRLPLQLYAIFTVEQRHGFNKQNLAFFIREFAKRTLLWLALTCFAAGKFVQIRKDGTYFWSQGLWMAFTVTCFMWPLGEPHALLNAFFYDPEKYVPLEEGSLRKRLERLAQRFGFPHKKLFVVEGSRRSNHSNAYVQEDRILICDTLIKDKSMEDCDIEAVLGHELGHWTLHQGIQTLIGARLFGMKALLGVWLFAGLSGNGTLSRSLGLPQAIFLELLIILQFVLPVFSRLILDPLENTLSRHREFQADAFAAKMGYGEQLKSALIKLEIQNLLFPVSDPLYSTWLLSHPSLLDRLEAIDKVSPSSREKMEEQKPPSNAYKTCVNLAAVLLPLCLCNIP